MAKTTKETSGDVTVTLTPEEIATIMAIREGKVEVKAPGNDSGLAAVVEKFIQHIDTNKPVIKKTPYNRVKNGPFVAKDGKVKPKLRRATYHHGLELHEDTLLPVEIELFNKLKPGTYCNGMIKVIKRKDRGIDLDYAIKTSAQRLKLVQTLKITSLESLLERLIEEAKNPAKFKGPDEDNDD